MSSFVSLSFCRFVSLSLCQFVSLTLFSLYLSICHFVTLSLSFFCPFASLCLCLFALCVKCKGGKLYLLPTLDDHLAFLLAMSETDGNRNGDVQRWIYVDGMGTETMEETISLSRQYRDAI